MSSFKLGDVVATNSRPTQPMDVTAVNRGKVQCHWVEGGKVHDQELPAEILHHFVEPAPTIMFGTVRAADEMVRQFNRL